MGTVIPFPSRARPQSNANRRPAAIPPWALPGMMAIAWSQAYGLALLSLLPHSRAEPGSLSGDNHVVVPWRGPRKQA
jgi:hypothetical protein